MKYTYINIQQSINQSTYELGRVSKGSGTIKILSAFIWITSRNPQAWWIVVKCVYGLEVL